MKRIYLFRNTTLLMLAVSCNTQPTAESKNVYAPILKRAQWILGSWTQTVDEAVTTENWTKLSDSVFAGESFTVVRGDTVFYESVTFSQKVKDAFYNVSLRNEKPPAPVSFQLTSQDDSMLVFENKKHDYPTKISYRKITQDSIFAEISGLVNGTEKKQGFPLKRLPALK
ncbi:DUF6265 family protein [Niabella insulamsoli]|uniref:DUF6265 family protein n=1 Tax=Niabella insulamsoli TaxID=3144874 RepID=UPI0031FCB6DE